MSNILKGLMLNEGIDFDALQAEGKKKIDAINANPELYSKKYGIPLDHKHFVGAVLVAMDREEQRANQLKRDIERKAQHEKSRSEQLAKDTQNIDQLKNELALLQKDFDPSYEYSDDYTFWNKQKDIASKISALKKRVSDVEGKQINELSPQTLASYKKKAGADATASDKRGDYKRGDKRMSGIIKATKKEFDNDSKGVKEGSMGTAVSQPPGSTVSAGQRFYKPRHVPNQDELQKQDVEEAKADPTSTWVVYDGDKVKRFKTHDGAKAYAEQHGGKVASSAHYADKIQGKQGVAEGVNDYLWHGSKSEHKILYPRQAKDTGGAEGSNKNAVYATPNAKFAIAMGLTTPGSDTGMFPNDSQMVLFSGKLRKGEYVYLHKVPKDLFIKHNGREWYSKPDVKEVKPIEVVAVPVDQYLNLIRQATPQDWKLRQYYLDKAKNKEQGVAEGWKDVVAGGAMALGALGAGAQTMPDINTKQVELANKYYNVLVQRAKEDGIKLDTRTLNAIKAKATDAAAQKFQQNTPQQQNTFPSQGSERKVSKDIGQFESQGVAEGKKSGIMKGLI